MQLLYDPAIPLLSIYPTEVKNYVHIKNLYKMFIAALFIIAQMETTLKFFRRCMVKQTMVHPYPGYYSVIQSNQQPE